MSVVSGILGANAATDAANTTAQANISTADKTLAQQQKMYDDQIAREKPFYDTGVTANANLDKMVNGGYDIKQSPAAQYQLTQGTKSLNRQLAARGLLGSGNAAQRLGELSSGVAANDYNQQYSRLLDQVKIGTGASASAGAASSTLSNQMGQNSLAVQNAQTAQGQARASLYSGMGGLTSNAVNTGINAYRAFNSGNSNGALYNDSGGNINNVDFGSSSSWGPQEGV